ncbi:MAG: KOW motif-containing protein [Candidatus Pacearchaeota archaeon]|nr:MAG: KOW motif-containing protein [Candidatus Pacearchaeota archaeon]
MHLKRIAMPRSWPLPKKERTFIVKGRGPHPSKMSLPLLVVLRDIIKEAKTRKEVKKILSEGLVLIDNRVIKDEKFNVGLFDRIYIKKLEKAFTVHLTKKGKLKIQEISKEKVHKKPCKVAGKKILKKNKVQINLHDGRNLIIKEKDIRVGGSIILDLKTNKATDYLKLDKGSLVLVIGGKHTGDNGKISDIDDKVSVVIGEKIFKISKENVFVIDKGELK